MHVPAGRNFERPLPSTTRVCLTACVVGSSDCQLLDVGGRVVRRYELTDQALVRSRGGLTRPAKTCTWRLPPSFLITLPPTR